ncbi:MAG: sterol desaturase family protein [Polyangiaceae bacterium]
MSVLIYYSIPIFLISLALELVWALHARAKGKPIVGYERRDTLASLAMGIGNVIVAAFAKVGVFALMTLVYEHRLFDLGTGAGAWVLLFFTEDFCYYWFHRASHEVRCLWAAHVNHHSSKHYNLSTALRQSWTTPFTAPLFWLPLPLLGFAPWMVFTQQAISLLYQFWIHTEALDKLGPFEWVFNTPSHHRVHHAKNTEYLDKNHGGILIIWDRLFGTFAAERTKPRYGLTKDIETFNPVTIAFHEWQAIWRDVKNARTLGRKLAFIFRSPAWRATVAD